MRASSSTASFAGGDAPSTLPLPATTRRSRLVAAPARSLSAACQRSSSARDRQSSGATPIATSCSSHAAITFSTRARVGSRSAGWIR